MRLNTGAGCLLLSGFRWVSRLLLLASLSALANETAITQVVMSETRPQDDPRRMHIIDVLNEVLQVTEAEFGPYTLKITDTKLREQRAVVRLESGKLENVHFGLTSKELERRLIPIRIPVRMGVLNYRLLLIHKDDLSRFQQIANIEQLKQLKMGLGAHWVTRQVVEAQGFQVVPSSTTNGIFKMLESRRIDYTVRGAHEVYSELERMQDIAPDIVVEPRLALHIVAPYYLFVSPHEPELAKRIEHGLTELNQSGRLRKLFLSYHERDVRRAEIEHRLIINIPNVLLPDDTPLHNSDLWLWPMKTKQ